MSQKISPVSLRLYDGKSFKQIMYNDLHYLQIWKKNMTILNQYTKSISSYGLLKLRRNLINRRLRLKHNMSLSPLNSFSEYVLSNIGYKTMLNSFIFKKPLVGVQFNYSVRPMQRRKKQVYFKK